MVEGYPLLHHTNFKLGGTNRKTGRLELLSQAVLPTRLRIRSQVVAELHRQGGREVPRHEGISTRERVALLLAAVCNAVVISGHVVVGPCGGRERGRVLVSRRSGKFPQPSQFCNGVLPHFGPEQEIDHLAEPWQLPKARIRDCLRWRVRHYVPVHFRCFPAEGARLKLCDSEL